MFHWKWRSRTTALVTLCSLPGPGAIPARCCVPPLSPGYAWDWGDVPPVSPIVPLLWWVQRAEFHPRQSPCLPLPQRAADIDACAGASPLVFPGSGKGDGESSKALFKAELTSGGGLCSGDRLGTSGEDAAA